MKLYIKQKVFSFGDKFTVWDAFGNDKYYVEGEVFTFGKKLHLLDRSGRELAFIKQEVFTWRPKFLVYRNERQIAEIRKEFTFFTQRYTVSGLDWDVDGDFMHHDYTVSKNGRPIVRISKEWFSWGDAYELEIADDADEIVALAVVLAIDCVLDAQQNDSN